jgi:hypothetical protein
LRQDSSVAIAKVPRVVSSSRRGEIVEEIVVWLRPWVARRGEAAVTAAVKEQLKLLSESVQLEQAFFDRRRNRLHAQKLEKALVNIEELIVKAPSILAIALFRPSPQLEFNDAGDLSMPRQSVEEIQDIYRARANSFIAELKRLRGVCSAAIRPGFGHHPNYEVAKHLSAVFARGLIQALSKNEVASSPDAPFREISKLLYEAVTGKRVKDLKRACDEVIRWT